VKVTTGRKCALVTGAGSGIGAATALQFARAGYDVAINYRGNIEGAERVAASCREFDVEAAIIKGDVADDIDCRSIASEAAEHFGQIDVLVNNAGVTRYAAADDMEASNAADFAAIFRVNVTGTYQMARAALPFLQQSGQGSIVNVSSDSAFSGSGSSLAYASSKGAVNTLTVGLARSLAPLVRVNAVCPGFVDTDWALAWQSVDEYAKFRQRLIEMAPLKAIPTASDIADTILWLADRARNITGQCIVIDSGAHLMEGA
jgi:3-oxoacyl-[acyl-carrier protein] reductase